jgi:hypothetical protein
VVDEDGHQFGRDVDGAATVRLRCLEHHLAAGQLDRLLIDPGTGGEGQMFRDPDDFGRFVAQHNWVDPVGMAELAGSVDFAMNQAWKPERSTRHVTG